MAFGVGNLGQIVSDFSESLNQIFGLGGGNSNTKSTGLFKPEYGGSNAFEPSKWVGNTQGPKVRYGFTILDAREVLLGAKGNLTLSSNDSSTYYLDIPPQAISQKEVFATNIQATRKGIIVESEGVVFKDIVIQGTTGVFPGPRGNYNGPKANLNLTQAPSPPAGVEASTGKSTASNVKTVSGYEEFLSLRQYFLKYAHDKVKNNGNLFLVFINEKDNQTLIVEPLEFTMDRNSKNPLQYQYKIVLKAIGSLNLIFAGVSSNQKNLLENIAEGVGNVSANLSAGIQQGRAAINATSTLLQHTFQAVDQTVNGPLQQLQFALADLANGITDTLSLPAILARNFNSNIAAIRANADAVGSALGFNNPADSQANAAQVAYENSVMTKIQTDPRVPIPRSFVQSTKSQLQSISDNLADAFNLSDPTYNAMKGRVTTNAPDPLKVVSDEEFILLGNVQTMTDYLNQLLATNSAYESDVQKSFDAANEVFTNQDLLQSNPDITLTKPKSVRQIKIQHNDTLERIAARELKNALRWPELVILNKLKAPYIDEAGGDGVKKPGEDLLVGEE